MRKIEGTKLRVKELHKQLLKIQEDSHKDFITYHSEKIDVTNMDEISDFIRMSLPSTRFEDSLSSFVVGDFNLCSLFGLL